MHEIIIADDHSIVRRGLALLCEETVDLQVVDEAIDGNQLLEKLKSRKYDVIILDIGMPGRDVFDTIKEIKQIYQNVPILIFTTNPEKELAVRLIKAGASGYINKESKPDELLDAIRRIALGGRYISPKLAELLADKIDEANDQLLHENLSNREFQIMRMIASGKTLTDIADKLYLSKNTVSNHRSRILQKLNLKTNSEISLYAVKHGIVEQ